MANNLNDGWNNNSSNQNDFNQNISSIPKPIPPRRPKSAGKNNNIFFVLVVVCLIFSFLSIWFFFFDNSSEEVDIINVSYTEIEQSEMIENDMQDEYYYSLANLYDNNYYCQFIINLKRKNLCMSVITNYFEPIIEDFD